MDELLLRREHLLLRRRDVADRLSVSLSQILKWERSGVLRPLRVLDLRAVRFAVEDVEALARRIVAEGREHAGA